ncbi:MAG: YIP1 family protein [Pseudomonadales bacterium]|nr:YIP1 family protein [Pseudomonadales bacterium]
MSAPTHEEPSIEVAPMSKPNLALNLLTAPAEAFTEIARRPSKLFPLLLIISCNALVLLWYFNIVDYDWYIDDVLSGSSLNETEMAEAREAMQSMSRTTMMSFAMLGGAIGVSVIFLLQATYLSLVSALRGDDYKFSHWFSLTCWAGLPFLLSTIGMAVTILLSPTGQLSVYDLDPLALRNLGMVSSNDSVQSLYNSISLSMVWSAVLILLAYRQWLSASWLRSAAVVATPYLLIVGVWAYFAFA